MRTYTKEEVKTTFGEYGVFSQKKLVGKMGYLIGVPPFDDAKLLSTPKKGALNNVHVLPFGLTIEALKGFSYIRIGFPMDSIEYFVIEPQQVILEKKEKSVVGRAVVGGLLLGPVGALVGGMSGMGTKEVKVNNDLPDNIVTMGYRESGESKQIVFALENKNLKEVTAFLEQHLPGRLKEPEAVTVSNAQPAGSIADEIIKLKSLLDGGALTQAEFDAAKAKLLQ